MLLFAILIFFLLPRLIAHFARRHTVILLERAAEAGRVGVAEVGVEGGQVAVAAGQPPRRFVHAQALQIDAEILPGFLLEHMAQVGVADVEAVADFAQAQAGVGVILLQIALNIGNRRGWRRYLHKELAQAQRVVLQLRKRRRRAVQALIQLLQFCRHLLRLRRKHLKARLEQRVLQVGK